jgi:hypothetical protein
MFLTQYEENFFFFKFIQFFFFTSILTLSFGRIIEKPLKKALFL